MAGGKAFRGAPGGDHGEESLFLSVRVGLLLS